MVGDGPCALTIRRMKMELIQVAAAAKTPATLEAPCTECGRNDEALCFAVEKIAPDAMGYTRTTI